MGDVQSAILDLLRASAIGSANAMTVDEIFTTLTARSVPIIEGRTQEHVRVSVKSLVKQQGQLIGSKSGFGSHRKGYYIDK